MMKNHINLMGLAGMGPLVGPNDSRFGERFPPMKYPYNRAMIKLGRAVAKEIGINSKVHEGVYICAGGPNYETLSEIKFMAKIGVDTVGMSTVHEAITAVHCGMKVFGFSLVTNTCLDEDSDGEEDVGHAAVRKLNISSREDSNLLLLAGHGGGKQEQCGFESICRAILRATPGSNRKGHRLELLFLIRPLRKI